MQAKTIKSEQVWQSSDGQRTIWEVTLRGEDGKEYRLKTYSSKISEIGHEGEVRSYVNPRGERFVRQVPDQRPRIVRDDASIRAQWAIGQAINLASVKMDKDQITLPVIEKYAMELYATVSRVKGEPVDQALLDEAERNIKGFTDAPGLF
jgi:hypothetical protein